MITHDAPAAPEAGPNLLKISESAFCVGLREAGGGTEIAPPRSFGVAFGYRALNPARHAADYEVG